MEIVAFAQLFANYQILFKTALFWVYMASLFSDLILGNIRAFVAKDIDSSVGVKGSLKHFGLFSFVVLFLPSLVLYTGDLLLAQMVLGYFIYQYIISIVENLAGLGFEVHPELAQYFRRLKEAEKNDNDDGSVL